MVEAHDYEQDVYILNCLLNYHQRVMMFGAGNVTCKQEGEYGPCPVIHAMNDRYSSALREAIRCIRSVHASELSDHEESLPAATQCNAFEPVEHSPGIL